MHCVAQRLTHYLSSSFKTAAKIDDVSHNRIQPAEPLEPTGQWAQWTRLYFKDKNNIKAQRRFAVRNGKNSSWPVTGLGNKDPLKVLNGTELILDDHGNNLDLFRTSLESFRSFRGPLLHKPVSSQELFLPFLTENQLQLLIGISRAYFIYLCWQSCFISHSNLANGGAKLPIAPKIGWHFSEGQSLLNLLIKALSFYSKKSH